MLNHEDLECICCGAHWMQNCSCTQEEVIEAERKRKSQRDSSTIVFSGSLKELLERLDGNG